MIKTDVLTFNPFRENTYIVSDQSGECVIIDAGTYSAAEDKQLTELITSQGYKPVLAINTHGHVDHILGVKFVCDTYNIPFAMHGDDKFLTDTVVEHGKIYGLQVREVPELSRDLKGVNEIKFGETTLQLIHTPGHTPGHICIFDPVSRTLFSGDTLFKESIGRTDLPGGNYSWIMKSILEGIVPLGDDVRFYPGHGPSSTIGHEMLYNPFITEVVQGDVNYKQ